MAETSNTQAESPTEKELEKVSWLILDLSKALLQGSYIYGYLI